VILTGRSEIGEAVRRDDDWCERDDDPKDLDSKQDPTDRDPEAERQERPAPGGVSIARRPAYEARERGRP
jgi:hypothetical protein